ncbi:MAG: transporter substrate-binding domain-containing protein [Myxococcales bacterium]|nr:transporter substrate-binding domain-containing protein [Myxococcales bacterium]
MTRLLLRAPLVLLLLVFAGCQSLATAGGGSAGSPPGRLPSILASRELVVGLSGNQPPLNMKSRSGEIIGLEVDLVNALAGAMGLEVRFTALPFADLLPALENGELDLVISGLTITPERNSRVAFAGPYFISGKSVLTKQDRIASVRNPADLDDPARRYAALAGSTSQDFVEAVFTKAKVVPTSDYDTAVKMVMDGHVDALIADFPICSLSLLRYPDAGLSTLATPFTIEPLGIALPADDPLFVNLVQNYLTTLENTGILTQLKARWFSDGSWLAELP